MAIYIFLAMMMHVCDQRQFKHLLQTERRIFVRIQFSYLTTRFSISGLFYQSFQNCQDLFPRRLWVRYFTRTAWSKLGKQTAEESAAVC